MDARRQKKILGQYIIALRYPLAEAWRAIQERASIVSALPGWLEWLEQEHGRLVVQVDNRVRLELPGYLSENDRFSLCTAVIMNGSTPIVLIVPPAEEVNSSLGKALGEMPQDRILFETRFAGRTAEWQDGTLEVFVRERALARIFLALRERLRVEMGPRVVEVNTLRDLFGFNSGEPATIRSKAMEQLRRNCTAALYLAAMLKLDREGQESEAIAAAMEGRAFVEGQTPFALQESVVRVQARPSFPVPLGAPRGV